ncbi:MAG: DUF3866 family protein [Microthrixaceae bacterium]
MPSFRTAEVTEVISERRGLQRLRVDMPDGSSARAYGLTQLIGTCDPGDRVVLNTTAVELDLGTGGWHFVHWNLSREDFVEPGPEHIMKMRYTSLQIDAGTDELNHPECDLPIDGVPVVVCSVHSQVAAVAASFAASAPELNLVYVMTDGAALPLALSDLVATMTENGTIAGSITAGHAFGGDMEAVSVPAALGLAVHTLGADAVVVGMGPGVVGTGTALGTTAIEVAPILDAVADAGGVPIMCVRASSGDPRPRHQGISHHTVTSARLTHSRPWVAPVPPEAADLPGVRASGIGGTEDPPKILAMAGLKVTTMGRSVEEDRLFFAAAAAAGTLAATVATQGESALGEDSNRGSGVGEAALGEDSNLDRE